MLKTSSYDKERFEKCSLKAGFQVFRKILKVIIYYYWCDEGEKTMICISVSDYTQN